MFGRSKNSEVGQQGTKQFCDINTELNYLTDIFASFGKKEKKSGYDIIMIR